MAKQIKSTDIVEKDVFKDTIASAESLLVSLKQINVELKGIGKEFTTSLKSNPLKSTGDVKQYSKDVAELDGVTKQLAKTQEAIKKTEDAIIVARKQEAFELAKLNVEKQEVNRQTKLEATVQSSATGAYKKTSTELIILRNRYKDYLTLVAQGVKLSDTQQKEFDQLAVSVNKLDNELKDIDKTAGQFQRNVGDYRGQLQGLLKELQQLTPGSDRFNQVAKEAGELKDKIDDAKAATKAFATESKATQAKNLFSQIGSDIADLDFKGAAEKAQQFAAVVKSISFAEVLGGLKSLGSALLNVGKALIANPFTALIAALAAVGYWLYENSKLWGDNTAAIQTNNDVIQEQIDKRNELRGSIEKLNTEILKSQGKLNDFDAQSIGLFDEFDSKLTDLNKSRLAGLKQLLKDFDVSATAFRNQKKGIQNALGLTDADLKELEKDLEDSFTGTFKDYSEFLDKAKVQTTQFNSTRLLLEEEFNAKFGALSAKQTEDFKKEQEEKRKKAVEEYKKYLEMIKKANQEIEDLQNSLIADDNIRQQERLKLDAKRRIEDVKNTVTDKKLQAQLIALIEEKLLQDLYKLNKDYYDKLKKAEDELLKDKEALRKKESDDALKSRQDALKKIAELEKTALKEREDAEKENEKKREERRKEQLKTIKELTDKTIEGINKRKQAEIKQLDDEIKSREKNIDRQEELAKQGLSNTLAFEKQKLAEAELEKKRLQEEQERREKRQIFLKSVIASLEGAKNPSEAGAAIAKAFALTVLAESFSNAFASGVENLNGPGTETSDSIPAWLSKGESVVTARGTKMYKGLATAMNDGKVNEWVNKNAEVVPESQSNYQALKELKEINKSLRTQTQVKIDWNSHDERVETLIANGNKRTIRTVLRKPRI
jgi:hypothetical protein